MLTEYRRGEWRPPPAANFSEREELPARQTIQEAPVHQSITIEPLDRDELFCVWPFTHVKYDSRIAFFPMAQRVARQPLSRGTRFAYELGTTAFWQHEQAILYPYSERRDAQTLLQLPQENGRDPLPALRALAQQCLGSANLPLADRYRCARAMEQLLGKFRGDISYSLEGQARDASLDPIEDFVSKHPRGHCEYFATALCLMLRSQNIPARVVVGFRTGEFNGLGGFFQVRQLHAHTWVEVYLAPTQIPAEAIKERPSRQWLRGAWLRLDPTPAAAEQPSASLLARIGGLFGDLNFAWTNYIVEMDRPRQRQAIYAPVADALRRMGQAVTDVSWWKAKWDQIVAAWDLGRLRNLQRWASWHGLGDMLIAALLAVVIYASLRWLYRRWIGPWFHRRARSSDRMKVRVGFYRRFEAILARRGIKRQTLANVARAGSGRRQGAFPPERRERRWRGCPWRSPTPIISFVSAPEPWTNPVPRRLEQALIAVDRALAGYPPSPAPPRHAVSADGNGPRDPMPLREGKLGKRRREIGKGS